LCQSQIDWFNAAAWDDQLFELLIAHRNDQHSLANLADNRKLTSKPARAIPQQEPLALID
jgi:hypothetical protein